MSNSLHGTHLVHRGAQTRLIGTKPDKDTVPGKADEHWSTLVPLSLVLSGLDDVKRS